MIEVEMRLIGWFYEILTFTYHGELPWSDIACIFNLRDIVIMVRQESETDFYAQYEVSAY